MKEADNIYTRAKNGFSQKQTEAAIKQKSKQIIVVIAVFAPFFIYFLYSFTTSIIKVAKLQVYDIEDTEYLFIEDDQVYYFDALEVVSRISEGKTITPNDIEDLYLVRFRDMNNELCYAFLEVHSFNVLLRSYFAEYRDDGSYNAGDITLSGCFIANTHKLNGDVYEAYQDKYPANAVNMEFLFCSSSPEMYIESEKSNEMPNILLMGGLLIFMLLPIVLVVFRAYNAKKAGTVVPASSGRIMKSVDNKRHMKSRSILIAIVSFVFVCIVGQLDVGEKLGRVLILPGAIGIVFGVVQYFMSKKYILAKARIDEIFENNDSLMAELDRAYYINGEFRCTPKLLVFPGGHIFPRDKVVWIYQRESKIWGITSGISLIVVTEDCNKTEVPLSDRSDVIIFNDMMLQTINTFETPPILGYSKEAIEKFDEYRRRHFYDKYNKK